MFAFHAAILYFLEIAHVPQCLFTKEEQYLKQFLNTVILPSAWFGLFSLNTHWGITSNVFI